MVGLMVFKMSKIDYLASYLFSIISIPNWFGIQIPTVADKSEQQSDTGSGVFSPRITLFYRVSRVKGIMVY